MIKSSYYKVITVYTHEEARHHGRPLYETLVEFLVARETGARCIVTKGISGCYETGKIASRNILMLSTNMPLKIEIILPSDQRVDEILREIISMVTDGIVAYDDIDVVSHRSQSLPRPKRLRIRDVMTYNPEFVTPSTPLSDLLRILFNSSFKGLPVVDNKERVVGIITHDDLLSRGNIPLRLDLIGEMKNSLLLHIEPDTTKKYARDIMTTPVISVLKDEYLSKGISLMVKHNLKRLPVVDDSNVLRGIISRFDIFKTISSNPASYGGQNYLHLPAAGTKIKVVRDILRRDVDAVSQDTSVWELAKLIYANDIQRVAVIDENRRLLGIVDDKDIFAEFTETPEDIVEIVVSKFAFRGIRYRKTIKRLKLKKAEEVMKKDFISAKEETPIEVAMYIMEQQGQKHLPVVNSEGKFQGLISREDILKFFLQV